ncbi:MAG TPA: BRCT domain-containing protein [Parvularculaceae bacterium]|nr:BRCT domain-containing protein [Amphiplicatus sp.]MCB9954646.1 BRCT domain-containing protein [Caulobacterales bacterium]HPE32660.1 BRCT domain-containing protein [Parvularculaceae bacterium]HRX38217.1 BRCT domain-containing protein [Parvularculaceae bacterium]
MNEKLHSVFGEDRLSSRQVDEMIGLAKGIAADGKINFAEAEFLQKWLSQNLHITDHPLVRTLYARVSEMLGDGSLDVSETVELLDTLNRLSSRDFELGEAMKATTLPLCSPAPDVTFLGSTFCFTGTFVFGNRKQCEEAVIKRGGNAGSLTAKTNFVVIGTYATDSWKHSSFGNKILKACEYRDKGYPISLVSEEHWHKFL